MEFNFQRYLEAKKTVDDRALNETVWRRLQEEIERQQSAAPLRILEVGAGTGTMLVRMLERGLLKKAEYLGIDQENANTTLARQGVATWAQQNAWEVEQRAGEVLLRQKSRGVIATFETTDVEELIQRNAGKRQWDLLVAHAFLDLFDVSALLPRLAKLISPDGLAYFTVNFDGETILEPVIDPLIERLVIDSYHRSMDERLVNGLPSGDSKAGRHLFQHLQNVGFEILEAGSSDWVVYSHQGRYPADEAYFLRSLLHFFEESLSGQPGLDPKLLGLWLAGRRAQIERGELVYIAHQLDFLARAPIQGKMRST